MSKAQAFIDRLRGGDFHAIYEFKEYTDQKYREVLGEPVAADELTPLMIYELLLTNINEHDLESLLSFLNRQFYLARIGVIGSSDDKYYNAIMNCYSAGTYAAIINQESHQEIQAFKTKSQNPLTKDNIHSLVSDNAHPINAAITRLDTTITSELNKPPTPDDAWPSHESTDQLDAFILGNKISSLQVEQYYTIIQEEALRSKRTEGFNPYAVINKVLDSVIQTDPLFTDFRDHITALESTATSFREKKALKDANTAIQLAIRIKLAVANYIQSPKTLSNLIRFESACQNHLTEPMVFSTKYLWIDNWKLALFTLCIGFIIARYLEWSLLTKNKDYLPIEQSTVTLSAQVSSVSSTSVCNDDIRAIEDYLKTKKPTQSGSGSTDTTIETLHKVLEALKSTTLPVSEKQEQIAQLIPTNITNTLLLLQLKDMISSYVDELRLSKDELSTNRMTKLCAMLEVIKSDNLPPKEKWDRLNELYRTIDKKLVDYTYSKQTVLQGVQDFVARKKTKIKNQNKDVTSFLSQWKKIEAAKIEEPEPPTFKR